MVHASLPYDEEVFLWTPEDGFGFYEIGDIVENERPARAVSFDPKTLRVSTHRVTDYITNPTKRIYRVRLKSGREVLVTRDHNLFTVDEDGGVTRLPSEEAEGSRVMVPGRLPDSPTEETEIDLVSLFEGDGEVIAYATDGLGAVKWDEDVPQVSRRHYDSRNAAPLSCISPAKAPGDVELAFKQSDAKLPRQLEVTPEFGWVLGFYIAEGSARRKQVQFANKNEAYLDRVAAWFERYDTSIYRQQRNDGVGRLTVCSALWSKVFRQLAGSGGEKGIPNRSWNWSESVLEALLEGLLDGDGCRRDSRDTLYTANESLANEAMYLAARLGLHSSVYGREREVYIEPSDVHNEGTEWAVDTATEPHKRGQYVPTPSELLRQYRRRAGMTMSDAAEAMGYASPSSISNVENEEYDAVKRETLRRFRDAYADAGVDTTRLDQILEEEVRFEEVVEVEETDRVEPTYDLEVQPNGKTIENFLGGRGGVFLSNTAGLCDPGYEGQITLELSNLGTAPVALTPEMRISQLTFTELKNPAERPYGEERGSKYQGQAGPQASRIQSDEEFGGEQVDR
ncbi:LAGLIDADG family homing endonuclease [Natronomonas marina]|uniref:LAGLIDADG family homing endonuclease n=1 Tax=Natronomonas marina TaxID=2961939 RepID=UPI003D9CB2FB